MNVRETLETLQLKRDPARVRIRVTGRVQGVGFRPSVYRVATRAGAAGWVRNTRIGVVIEVEGSVPILGAFLREFEKGLPPLARIDTIATEEIEPAGATEFTIAPSEKAGAAEALFPVDTAVCADCLAELRDPGNKRYRYPFINCTNCGPRFTIIEGLPYDRPLTTMHEFEMDGFCRSQYSSPSDRRFHAEPISCPDCGPSLMLFDETFTEITGDPIAGAVALLRRGRILAVKGLGGYHLACLAENGDIVERLRERKKRPAKPFACMFRDIGEIERRCVVGEEERRMLLSSEAPIVLLRRRGRTLPEAVAPRNGYIGAFLPYTPVHHLLMEHFEVLIMTSANFTDEPLISMEEELGGILGTIADAALVHNRRIAHKCDDSIVFAPEGAAVPLRRARGYVPEPLAIPGGAVPNMAALGSQEKSVFALSKENKAYLSPHLGDLGDARSEENYRRELAGFARMLAVAPEIIVHDLHPDYFTTRLAASIGGARKIAVQHHHAHAAGVMAEHGLAGPAIAVVFDGTGYGTDGALWGGEFFLARYDRFERLATLRPVRLPGGEAAIREPWRMALVHLQSVYGNVVIDKTFPRPISFEGLPAEQVLAIAMRGINSPLASSMGRLFDAIAFLLDCGALVSYEAEAAVALEALALDAADTGDAYAFTWKQGTAGIMEIDPRPVVEAIVDNLAARRDRAAIAAAFHRAVAKLVVDLSEELSRAHDCADVVLSGGVFQNRLLCESVMDLARGTQLRFRQHRLVPPNDGGIAYGQLVVGAARIREGSERLNG